MIYNPAMDYLAKVLKKISIKSILTHTVGLIVSMSIIWGVSYLILITFSIQEGAPTEVTGTTKVASSTLKIATSTHATSSKIKK